MSRYLSCLSASCCILLAGLSPQESAVMAARTAVIKQVPHIHQAPVFSGEACAAMFLSRNGGRVRPKDVFNRAAVEPVEGRGCRPLELRDALRRLGVETGQGIYNVPPDSAADARRQLAAMQADLARGVASITMLADEGEGGAKTNRFLLVTGYDADRDSVVYHDPTRRDGASLSMPRANWLQRWPTSNGNPKSATLVRISLATKRPIVVPATEGTAGKSKFTSADYAGHVYRLRSRLPSDDFHVVISKPFVVVGDVSHSELEKRARGTVHWAVERLKAEYFPQDPEHILDVWLFKDETSYRHHTKQVFGDRPSTPFGYYSRQHRALIMNIATGGGTLVHEIVHPFMASNFSKCPAWFNEGLASLYEQSGERRGHIVGYTNWRLAGLQKSIKKGSVPPFQTLCETTDHEFYRKDPGTNYAQARYLCYYLQENGLLHKFYHDFRSAAADDPSGYKTLAKVLGEPEMRQFQKQWEDYVLNLRF